MQQRQLRLGDILDDYCPRERRLTNHVVVAMVGDDVKQTRCTTCDADHEYKHAQGAAPAAQGGSRPPSLAGVAGAPKRVVARVRPSDAAAETIPSTVDSAGVGRRRRRTAAADPAQSADEASRPPNRCDDDRVDDEPR